MSDKNDTQLDSEAATQNEPKQNEFGLLPCPFCGTTDLEPYPDGDMVGHMVMGNHEKGCLFDVFCGFKTWNEATASWNTRVSDKIGE